jgi:Holliday junction resolvase-like predicted endonuclease
LSAADRDLYFWTADFWNEVSNEVFETEAFALALARYLQQIKVTRPGWLQHLVAKSSDALRRAIRYSQVLLSPTELRWKEIIELDLGSAVGLSDFIKTCEILQGENRKFKNAIKSIETELKRLTPMETLVYASLFAFKHVVYSLGQQELRPDLLEKDRADASRVDFQETTDAINQILISKLKTSGHSDFFISERIIGESLRKHMSALLFPSPSTARAAEKCLFYLDTFERLVAAYLEFNEFVGKTINCFCFDEDYDIRFEGERLIVYPRVNPEGYEWGRNGKKLDRLHQYWHFRAIDEFIKLGLAFERFGSPENEESNRFAWISSIRTKLELTEIYGLDDEITTDSGFKIDLLRTLLTIELMHAFYKHCYILPYCKHQEQTGNWLSALTAFSFAGLIEGEIRFPITFAERKAKIARICNWTSSEEWPKGNKQLTEAILDFWSNDLKDLSRLLREHEHALQPELHERPIFKIGNYLFELPWVFAFQNNVTAAVNNLRRLGRNRGELNIETNRIEKQLAETFKQFGFNVLGNFHPPRDADAEVGEIDLICFRDDHLFIFEIKSGYMRKTQRDAWQHRTNTLRKAALQLKRKSALVTERLTAEPTLSALIVGRESNQIQTHCWIIDTSIEHDHEYFEGFLKVSLQEIIIALRNERHLLRDMHQAITEQQKRNSGRSNEGDFRDVCGEVMIAIGEQNPRDDLYPNGFTADQSATIIEHGLIWKVLD